ncbi:unnamed protein product [Sphenostylis stenocarpa]|uniref:Uncharacterized protein n=1 Tax=Sphenostylis stenocarpa TaxID=92480 RepID=A0AA86SGK3_9FABA|nr:unnamed protein product [Sphenostylis stenocarpa]
MEGVLEKDTKGPEDILLDITETKKIFKWRKNIRSSLNGSNEGKTRVETFNLVGIENSRSEEDQRSPKTPTDGA